MSALLLALLCATTPIPALSGPVVDAAGLLDVNARARLESLARAARALNGGQGVQLQILTVPSLDGEPIEDFSIRVAEAWKVGTKGSDNGLLFTVAKAEHKFRLEVGGGLEGDLTDIQSQHILDDTLTPAFRRGDYGGGLYAASVEALSAVHGLPQGAQVPQAWSQNSYNGRRGPSAGGLGLLAWLLLRHPIVLLFLVIVFFWLVRRRIFFLPFGFGGGGGFSGGGGGGGGWSGGGGGFSGGGASGGW